MYSKIKTIKKISTRDSYELSIAETHCFYCNGILKHNCRCISLVSKHDGKTDIRFISRQEKPFTTLDNLKEGVSWYVRDLPDGDYVTDGEICKVDENGDEDFQAIMKEIRRKDHTIADPCYQMFDFCTKAEWDGTEISPNFTERLAAMKDRMQGNMFKTIKLVEQERITNQETYDKWIKRSQDGNWEGIMLRKDVPFVRGRTSNLLKVKPFEDDEFEVFATDVGEMTTSVPGQGNVSFTGVRAILIKEKHGGIVHVGSGLTREQRIDWYEHPDHIIGKTVCVKYQKGGNTQNQNGEWSLRLPILKYVYEGKRDV